MSHTRTTILAGLLLGVALAGAGTASATVLPLEPTTGEIAPAGPIAGSGSAAVDLLDGFDDIIHCGSAVCPPEYNGGSAGNLLGTLSAESPAAAPVDVAAGFESGDALHPVALSSGSAELLGLLLNGYTTLSTLSAGPPNCAPMPISCGLE